MHQVPVVSIRDSHRVEFKGIQQTGEPLAVGIGREDPPEQVGFRETRRQEVVSGRLVCQRAVRSAA